MRISPRAFRVASAADTFPLRQTRHVVASHVRTARTNWSYLRACLIAKLFYCIGVKSARPAGKIMDGNRVLISLRINLPNKSEDAIKLNRREAARTRN